MIRKYEAYIRGGAGEHSWDTEVYVEGEEMTLRGALDEIEKENDSDTEVYSICEIEDVPRPLSEIFVE